MDRVNKYIYGVLILCLVSGGFLLLSFAKPDSSREDCGYYPGKTWRKEKHFKSAGWSAQKLEEAHQFAKTLNMGGVVVLYKGKILQAWGDVQKKFPEHSVRKSFMSALYGPAVAKGKIDLDATMENLRIDDIEPALSEEEKQATVKMLLQARSGIYHPAAFETKGMAARRPKRHSHKPGTFWYYNNWDFNVLGAIYKQQTGMDIFQAFKKNIADPIEMQDFNPEKDGRYVYDRKKSKYPAYPFKMSAMNMARFGLLMARNGRWKDKQIIPKFWIKQSTVAHSKTGSRGGYGYLWWTSINGVTHFRGLNSLYGLFSARGYLGHVITVIPDKEIVFVYSNNDYNRNDAGKRKRTTYTKIGRLLKMVLDAKVDEFSNE